MEVEDQDGAKIELSKKAVFGRGSGVSLGDRTVSRRHLAFEVVTGARQTEPRVLFEVLGKNPVWVRRSEEDEVRVFRSSEKGRLSEGDRFCLSGNEPNWFALRKIGDGGVEPRVSEYEYESEFGSDFEDFDVSDIDPVKEFGFVVMGHEFDLYPRHMIRDAKRWDWFLEDDRKESSDDEEGEFGKRKKEGARKKRKKSEENEDEDWTGESEDDKEIVGTVRKEVRPKYSTRSKDSDKLTRINDQGSKKLSQYKIYNSNRDDNDDDDDDDETLGGFIAGDNEMDQEEEKEINGDDEEDEEFVEDDYEDE